MNEPAKPDDRISASRGSGMSPADPSDTVDAPKASREESAADSEATTGPSASTPASGRKPPNTTLDYVSSDSAGAFNLGETVDKAVASSRDDSSFSVSPPDGPGHPPAVERGEGRFPVVPGYEILEVLGRGAMGVVYKARHRNLKRMVALKMILAGDQANDLERDRFRVEAEAAAQLQHANIVQVYEVGEQNGCSFLSLEYVNGGSLKERLRGTPQPVQAAAELVQVLAQAMDYAHRKGIVHRDLKPANVMLMQTGPSGPRTLSTPSSGGRGWGGSWLSQPGASESTLTATPLVDQLYGIPKIADFGLAKQLEGDSSQTRSGTILGTPSYMAPEQAAGRSKDVGPLADQHALGAVLYELLTGRPPFHGATMLETLEQVRFQEPVPPSRLQPKVPRDLENICLKCLQKEPSKRYPHASALAEDLHRFIRGEPILARPVSAPERVLRWCRRNPRVATLTGSVIALGIALLFGSIYYNVMLTEETKEKEKQRKFADEQAQLAKKNEAIAKEQRDRADESAKVAKEQRKLALTTLGSLITTVQNELKKEPRTQNLRRKVLEIAMKDLQAVAKNLDVKISLKDSSLAAAHRQMGQIFLKLGKTSEARDQYQKSDEIYAAMAQQDPSSAEAKAALASSKWLLGLVNLKMKGQTAIARDHYLQARNLAAELEKGPRDPKVPLPAIQALLAEAEDGVGWTTIDANPKEALEHYLAAMKIRRQLMDNAPEKERANWSFPLSNSYLLVSGASFRSGQESDARQYLRLTLQIRQALAEGHPDNMEYQRHRGFALQRQGDLDLRTGHLEEARVYYLRALDIYRKLVDKEPDDAGFKADLGRSYYDVATVAWLQKNKETATKNYQEACKLRQALADLDREDISARKELMIALARCGQDTEAAKLADSVLKGIGSDPSSLVEVAGCYALCYQALGDNPSASAEKQKRRDTYLEASLKALQRAVDNGFRDRIGLTTEPDLIPIHGQLEYEKIVKELNEPAATTKRP
jgi:serine/threonine protein kinase